MAIVSVSLDTVTRQAVLTVNGILVPSVEFNISKYLKYDTDNEFELNFSYTVENDQDGIRERRQFYLPSLEKGAVDAHSNLNESGLASKPVYDDEKAKADVVEYLANRKAR